MLIDCREQNRPSEFSYDICIVGSGAAGITLARSLSQTKLRICLLESGGTDFDPAIQSMAEGSSTGYPYYDLVDSRLRFFGGTTTIWGGRCALLDAEDFEKRPWVAESGWPFERDTLIPYYKQVQESLALDPILLDNSTWSLHGLQPPPFDRKLIDTSFWQFDNKSDRFVLSECEDILKADNIDILLHATLTGLELDESGEHVKEVTIADVHGFNEKLKARVFVLACGGLENARVLLNSRGVHKNGVGNNSDNVGRYFMEHPHARGGKIVTRKPWEVIKLLSRSYNYGGKRFATVARAGRDLQESESILNSSFSISARRRRGQKQSWNKRAYQSLRHNMDPTVGHRKLWQFQRKSFVNVGKYIGSYLRWLIVKSGYQDLYAVIRAEQSPNRESRISLTDDRDVLGLNKINLSWQFNEIDKRSVRVLMQKLDEELRRLKLGHLELAPWLEDTSLQWETDELVSNHPIAGYHHMGVTRMAESAERGVVDKNCQVFGTDNLFIAGSSVFPTSGWANPTLTIMAMSVRLGDHLKAKLGL